MSTAVYKIAKSFQIYYTVCNRYRKWTIFFVCCGKTIFISSARSFATLKINSTEHQLSCLSIA